MVLKDTWETNDSFTADDQNDVSSLVNTHTTQIADNTSAIETLGAAGDPIDLASLASVVDFGFCQSELGNQDWFSEIEIRQTLQGMADAGAVWVRFAAWWRGIEQTSTPGAYTWTGTDRCLNLIEEYGLKPLMCITLGGVSLLYGATISNFANLCSAIAARYGSDGTDQLHHYEIWNEPNNSAHAAPFSFGASPYTTLMTQASAAIRAADDDAFIISAGLMSTATFSTTDISPSDFLQGIYDNNGGDSFDAVGFHWYSGAPDFSGFEEPTRTQYFYLELMACRDIMVAEGDASKDIWLTEIGFSATDVPANTRAEYMAKQIELIEDTSFVRRWFIYNFRPGVEAEDFPDYQYGTVNFDFSPKQPIYNYVASINATVPAALSGLGGDGTGDMLVSVYDPNGVADDAFDRANHTGTLSAADLTGTTAQFNNSLSDANFYTTSGTDVSLADGGTGASLADPNADRIMFWDDSAGLVTWLTPGTNLTVSGTTLNAAGGGGGSGAWGIFEDTVGDGVLTSIPVVHNLGGPVVVGVRLAADDSVILCDVELTDDDTVTLGFDTAPATNAVIVTIVGGTATPGPINTSALTDPNADRILFWDDSAGTLTWLTLGTNLSISGTTLDASGGAGGGDASTNTSSSVDSEVALFSGTGGKTIKRATGTGLAKLTSGVLSTAAAGTDYLSPSGSAAALTSFPTLNQNTTGSAATLTTARTINGVSFNGSANITIIPRVNTTASSATPSINTDTTDQFTITALAAAITSMTTNLTGTPVDGQKLTIRIKDNGTARTITWGASFISSGVATLLATTVISKTHMIGLVYDSAAAKWVCMAVDATGY